MKNTKHPVEELREVTEGFHHLRNAHKHEREAGSTRRRQGVRLTELEGRFEILLSRWVGDEATRSAWRKHFYHTAPAPSEPPVILPPLFKGHSNVGSRVEVHQGADGNYDVIVDGTLVSHLPREWSLGTAAGPLRIEAMVAEEVFEAPELACEALQGFVAAPTADPPWEWARDLFEDGLIDPNFCLTARGQRMLAARRR